MRVRIIPYRRGSKSVRALRDTLSCKSLKLEGSRFRPRWSDFIINWGNCSQFANDFKYKCILINPPDNCRLASNKLASFHALKNYGVQVPEFTEDYNTALDWLQQGTVIARTKLRASAGDGIVVCNPGDNLPHCNLYTKYVKKKHEYRIHVINGEVVDRQRKMRTYDVPDEQVNWVVRNMEGGFVFGRENINVPESVDDQAIKAVQALGLDFGAVDVIYNEHHQQPYVLEVNTAPGLVNTTLNIYTEKLREMIQSTRVLLT